MPESLFAQKLHSLGFKTYQDYLRSPHWESVREKYRTSRYSQFCLSCQSRKYHLHHLTYLNLGNESFDDLMALCENCHTALHASMKESGTWAYTRSDALTILHQVKERRRKPAAKHTRSLKTRHTYKNQKNQLKNNLISRLSDLIYNHQVRD